MKKTIAIIAILVITKISQSQNPNIDYKYGLKLYNLSTLENTEQHIYNGNNKDYSVINITLNLRTL